MMSYIEKRTIHLKRLISIAIFIICTTSNIHAEIKTPPHYFSMQSHTLQGDTVRHTKSMELMHQAGVKMIRDEMYWSNIEREKDYLVIPDNYKQNVDITLVNGIQILLILDYGNRNYDNDQAPNTPEGRAAFARYCYTIVSTFKGKINYFEIWNEPNISGFWRPKPNPSDYALLLKEAYHACTSANPDAIILGGATSGVDIDFLDKVFSLGGLDYMDIVSVHPYRGDAPEYGDSLINQLNKVKTLISKYKQTKHIWITEMGFPTHTGSNGHSEEQQANYITRCYIEALSTGLVDSFFWYWFGPDGPDETYSEDRFGLVRMDWSLKPSYKAYQNMTRYLEESIFINPLKTTDSNLRFYSFKSKLYPTQILTIGWNIKELSQLSFTTKSNKILTIQRDGSTQDYYPYQSNFTFSVSEKPFYFLTQDDPKLNHQPLLHFTSRKLYSYPGGERTVPLVLNKLLAKDLKTKSTLQNKIEITAIPEQIQVEPRELYLTISPASLYSSGSTIRLRVPRISPPNQVLITAELIKDNLPRGFTQTLIVIKPAIKSWLRPMIDMESKEKGLIVFVENLSEEPLSGEVLMTTESELLLNEPTLTFSELHPGDTAQLKIDLSSEEDISGDNLYQVQANIFLPGFDIISISRMIDFYTCWKSGETIVIDGNLDEWEKADSIELNRETQLTAGNGNFKGPEDLDALLLTHWDDTNFYLAAIVIDSVLSSSIDQGSIIHRNDAIEIYFDTECNGDTGNKKFDTNDFQFGFSNTPKGPLVWRWSPGDTQSPGSKIVWKQVSNLGENKNLNGYVMEAAIPFEELKFKPEPGKCIGFTIAVDDDDTPEYDNPFLQDKQFAWAGSKFNWIDPSQFGFLFFGN